MISGNVRCLLFVLLFIFDIFFHLVQVIKTILLYSNNELTLEQNNKNLYLVQNKPIKSVLYERSEIDIQ